MLETPNNGEVNMHPELDKSVHFGLNEINNIDSFFIAEIRETGTISKTLSKYIASLFYFDKTLLVLSGTSGSVSIASFFTVIDATFETTRASFSFVFYISNEIMKQLEKKENETKLHYSNCKK